MQLRYELRARFEMLYHKSCINDLNKGGTIEFEFQQAYKSQLVIHRTNHGILRIKLLCYLIGMDPSNFDTSRESPVFVTLIKEMQDLRDSVMLIAKDVVLSPTLMMGDVLEIPIQVVGQVRMSLRNLRSGKKSMKDKGKMVNLETKDGISFKLLSTVYMPTMKLEDWDLADNTNSLEKMEHNLQ